MMGVGGTRKKRPVGGCAPRQRARKIGIASLARAPRSAAGTSQAANSPGNSPPTPIPRTSRPPESQSNDAVCLATSVGCRSGKRYTQVPRAIRRVAEAHTERAWNGSAIGCV